ncbi:MAG: ABC transporter permease [Sulfolobales archaeon]
MDRNKRDNEDLMRGNFITSTSIIWYLLSLAIIIVLWEVLSMLLSKPYTPGLDQVLRRIYSDLLSGVLIYNLRVSLERIFIALLISTSSALVLGILATWGPRFSKGFISSIVLLTYPIPHVALLPILFFLLGVEWSKIALLSIITFYPTALSVMEWSSRFPRDLGDLIIVMRGGRIHLIRYVIIPSSLPGILTGIRISLNTAFAVLFIVESLVGGSGVGYLIYFYWQRIDYTGMYSSILFLSLVGLSFYFTLRYIEHKVLRWLYI